MPVFRLKTRVAACEMVLDSPRRRGEAEIVRMTSIYCLKTPLSGSRSDLVDTIIGQIGGVRTVTPYP